MFIATASLLSLLGKLLEWQRGESSGGWGSCYLAISSHARNSRESLRAVHCRASRSWELVCLTRHGVYDANIPLSLGASHWP